MGGDAAEPSSRRGDFGRANGASEDVDPGANQDSSQDPAVQSRKSVIPPVHDGEGPVENERMAKLFQVPSPAASDEIPRNPRFHAN